MSLIASKILVLRYLWGATAIFAVISCVVLAWLILRRRARDERELYKEERKKRIRDYFFAVIGAPVELEPEGLPSLGRGEEPLVCEVALDLLRAVRGEARAKAAKLMTHWKMLDYLEAAAKSAKKSQSIQALTLLSYFKGDRALRAVQGQTEAKDIYVQLAALRSYASLDRTKDVRAAVEKLAAAQQTNTLFLADVLYRFGEGAVPSLINLAGSATQSEVRVAAIKALGYVHSTETAQALTPFLDDKDPDVRAQAIAVLGKMGTAEMGALIMRGLADETIGVRVQTAKALGTMSFLPALQPLLRSAVTDENWWVRLRAMEALTKLGAAGRAVLSAVGRSNEPAAAMAGQARRWISATRLFRR